MKQRCSLHRNNEQNQRTCHASGTRKRNIAKVHTLLGAEPTRQEDALTLREPCPDCCRPKRIIETFRRGEVPRFCVPPRRRAA